MISVTAFAPATVSNVACGFDVLGFALHEPGDQVTARWAPAGVHIADISGDDGRLPREARRNTAGVAAEALLRLVGETRGVSLSIVKGLPLSSGLGGSAASAAAAVVAVDALIGAHSSPETLITCALEGESHGAGSAHGDNIAPSICGGFVLVRRSHPPDIVRLPVPAGLTAVVVHPDLEIETAMARKLIGDTVSLQDAIQQPLHGFEPGDVRVGFLLLPEASSCQRSGGVTLTPKPFSRWRISSRRKPQACARRRTFNSIGRVAPLPANSHRFRQHAQPFPIADCGSRRTAFGSQFTYSDPYYSS